MLVLCPFCLVSPIQDGSTATIAVQEHLRPVPGDTPEPLFASTISARAREANLGSLRRKDLHGDGSELRVWVGFGKKPLEGFIINRSGEHWEATFLESINRTTHPPYQKRLTEPRSGWKQLWSRLVAAGV